MEQQLAMGRNSEPGSLNFGVEDKAKKELSSQTPQTQPDTTGLTDRNEIECENNLLEY